MWCGNLWELLCWRRSCVQGTETVFDGDHLCSNKEFGHFLQE